MESQEIHRLIDKYLSGEATENERIKLEEWYDTIDAGDPVFNDDHRAVLKSEMRSNIFSGIEDRDSAHTQKISRIKRTPLYTLRWAVAAILLIIAGITFFYTNPFGAKINSGNLISQHNDIPPGGNNAVLTLSDGSRVILNQVNDGKIYQHKNVSLNKENGLLVYKKAAPSAKVENIIYNTITTPKGGKYTILLSDGTKVWLNAASSLKYPAVFGGKLRELTLMGEAYFEVAKNAAMPFHVTGRGQTIEVLGTHFNVTNYPEEANIKTTLLEGSVKIIGKKSEVLLKPGEQSNLTETSGNFVVSTANTEEAIAWKNGFFQFDNASIQDIMNQISRWYNIDVVYQGKIPGDYFKGKVRRDANVSEALKILETSGINFKIEGRTIIVK